MKKIELPNICYARNNVSGEVIIIKNGESGYYPLDYKELRSVDELNKGLGVTKAQAEAMSVGSMFGWDVPGADPNNYDENGKFKKDVLGMNNIEE